MTPLSLAIKLADEQGDGLPYLMQVNGRRERSRALQDIILKVSEAFPKMSTGEIGKIFNRDCTTVRYSLNRAKQRRKVAKTGEITMNEEMDYEGLVAAIAMIDATLEIMGINRPDNVTFDTYRLLHDARNELNQTRLELLGNGTEKPYCVADLEGGE